MGNTKNFPKQTSYAFADSQMRHAIEQECFIEAVSIQESIISDRLTSFFQNAGISTERKQFRGLIIILENCFEQGRCGGLENTTIKELNRWRKERNIVIHAIVKSGPEGKHVPIEVFKARAKAAALRGRLLANRITEWHRTQKRSLPSGH